MNICLVSNEYPPESGFGGIGSYTYNLAQGLSEKGNEVTVIAQSLTKEMEYKDKKVTIYRVKDIKVPIKGLTRIANFLTANTFSRFLHSYSVFKKIDEIIKNRGRFDIIECPIWSGEGFLYSPKIGIPLVVRLQTPIFKLKEILDQKPNRFQEYFEKRALEKAVFAMAISNDIGRLVCNYYKVPKNKIKLCYLGVDLPKIKKPSFKKGSSKLLYVGRLETRKGTKEFIDALPEILEANSKITIDIVGKDIPQAPGNIFFKDYFRKAVQKKFWNKVKFHGFVRKSKLNKFYASCDVFIAPSRYESFGLIFLEAMAYGRPVIGTSVGGIPEIVKHNKMGLLIDVDNARQIAAAVVKLFAQEKLRKRLGDAAFDHVRNNFSIDGLAEKSLKIYTKAIIKFHERRK